MQLSHAFRLRSPRLTPPLTTGRIFAAAGTQSRDLSTTQSRVDSHLSNLQSIIHERSLQSQSVKQGSTYLDPLWIPRLHKLKRPEARSLIPALTADNSLGFLPASGQAPGKTSLSYYMMQQKHLHPEKVLLVRVGEFYEAYGVDALMLIEHCGLNPMGMYSVINKPFYRLLTYLLL